MSEQFVFGYGSLINFESRSRTVRADRAGTAIPALVNGLRRGWNARYKPDESENWPYSMTPLGATFQENESANGVLVPVSEHDLEQLKRREKGYIKCQIRFEAIKFLTERAIPPDAVVHAYLWAMPLPANDEFPILQSYVDVVMTGCLELSRKHTNLGSFPADFVRSTTGWDRYWLNDRTQPRYSRAMKEIPPRLAKEIDGVLETIVGPILAKRKLLPRAACGPTSRNT